MEKLYPSDGEANFDRLIRSWTTAEFGVQILGSGANGKFDAQRISLFENWFKLVGILENIIKNNIDNFKYYILFDEDYKDYWVEYKRKKYLDLVVCEKPHRWQFGFDLA